MEGLGNILSQTCFSESCPLKGPAHSKNEYLYFSVPAQTKRMHQILVSCETPIRSKLQNKIWSMTLIGSARLASYETKIGFVQLLSAGAKPYKNFSTRKIIIGELCI